MKYFSSLSFLESNLKYTLTPEGKIDSKIFKTISSSSNYFRTVSIFDNESKGTISRDKKAIFSILTNSLTPTSIEDKSIGSMLGMCIGDAMGHRFEFEPVVYDKIELTDMGKGKGGHFELEPGQWTDDTSMGLCLADSLLVNEGYFHPRDLMHRFLLWWNNGYNNAFRFDENKSSCGLGGNISGSLYEYVELKGQNPYTKYGDENTSGNGSIMRNAAVPICFYKDINKGRNVAKWQSLVTHQGKEAYACCELLTFIVSKLINGEDLFNDVLNKLDKEFTCDVDSVNTLAKSEQEGDNVNRNWNWKDDNFKYSEERVNNNSGYIGSYCMDAMAMALHVVYTTKSFKDAIIKVVNLRGDSDSVGSVVGQIAGAYYGFKNIPIEWIKVIEKWDHQEIALRGYMLCHLFDDVKSRVN